MAHHAVYWKFSSQGPLGTIPGSHPGPIYRHYDRDGKWIGALYDEGVATLGMDKVQWINGRAGTITVLNACTLRGSRPHNSPRLRPLPLNADGSGDADSLTPLPGTICRRNETISAAAARRNRRRYLTVRTA